MIVIGGACEDGRAMRFGVVLMMCFGLGLQHSLGHDAVSNVAAQQRRYHRHFTNTSNRDASLVRIDPILVQGAATGQIPRILHHIFLEGEARYAAEVEAGHFALRHRRSCQQQHQHWTYMFWTRTEAEALVQAAYPWFWHTWKRYAHWVRLSRTLHGSVIMFVPTQCLGHHALRNHLQFSGLCLWCTILK